VKRVSIFLHTMVIFCALSTIARAADKKLQRQSSAASKKRKKVPPLNTDGQPNTIPEPVNLHSQTATILGMPNFLLNAFPGDDHNFNNLQYDSNISGQAVQEGIGKDEKGVKSNATSGKNTISEEDVTKFANLVVPQQQGLGVIFGMLHTLCGSKKMMLSALEKHGEKPVIDPLHKSWNNMFVKAIEETAAENKGEGNFRDMIRLVTLVAEYFGEWGMGHGAAVRTAHEYFEITKRKRIAILAQTVDNAVSKDGLFFNNLIDTLQAQVAVICEAFKTRMQSGDLDQAMKPLLDDIVALKKGKSACHKIGTLLPIAHGDSDEETEEYVDLKEAILNKRAQGRGEYIGAFEGSVATTYAALKEIQKQIDTIQRVKSYRTGK
jgi:hypothetical protein